MQLYRGFESDFIDRNLGQKNTFDEPFASFSFSTNNLTYRGCRYEPSSPAKLNNSMPKLPTPKTCSEPAIFQLKASFNFSTNNLARQRVHFELRDTYLGRRAFLLSLFLSYFLYLSFLVLFARHTPIFFLPSSSLLSSYSSCTKDANVVYTLSLCSITHSLC